MGPTIGRGNKDAMPGIPADRFRMPRSRQVTRRGRPRRLRCRRAAQDAANALTPRCSVSFGPETALGLLYPWYSVCRTPGHRQLSLRRQCELLSLSRSTWYYQPRGEPAENLRWMRRRSAAWTRHCLLSSSKRTISGLAVVAGSAFAVEREAPTYSLSFTPTILQIAIQSSIHKIATKPFDSPS
jgi:hypothetical protein